MNTIVLDLEWNQSSSGKEAAVAVMPFEIIEIGAIKLNEKYEAVGEFSELIRPQVYKQLYRITSKLIHLQMEELQRGDTFENVSDRFLDWCGEDFIFCTWGPADITELQRNLRYFKKPLINNGPVRYIDGQKLFSLAYEEDSKLRRSLEFAVDFLDIAKDIPFHRAFSDAYYTAKVMEQLIAERPELLKYVSYDVTIPPQSKEEEIEVIFDTYSKFISRAFPSRDKALKDQAILQSKCYLCGTICKKQIPWFSTNGKHYLSVAKCPKHGALKGKIRIQKLDGEQVCIVKTHKLIDAAEVRKVEERRKKAMEAREKKKSAEAKALGDKIRKDAAKAASEKSKK